MVYLGGISYICVLVATPERHRTFKHIWLSYHMSQRFKTKRA